MLIDGKTLTCVAIAKKSLLNGWKVTNKDTPLNLSRKSSRKQEGKQDESK